MAPLDISLKGQTAIITGGSKNLGAETVRELAKFGANLVIHYHSSSEKSNAESLVQEVTKEHGIEAFAIQADLSVEKDAEHLFSETKSKFGGVDIAINNAGKVLKKPIGDISEQEYDQMFDINSKTSFLFLKQAYKYVNEKGRIIFLVTSLLAAYTPFYGLYQGAKAPVEYFVKAASKELHDKQISVNAVAPGPMDTPFLYGQETDESVAFFKTQGLGNRLTKVEDIVPIVRFLATEGTWLTGQTLYASGGFTAH
ncbi:3-oxoacyl-[acyl-carrier-protein] reductase [Wickerhamomyces ciferrii]|uniref:3-oxoacyl-[acyl-carrier-protein] reductase n=1 Tax=Wickerhamomyces ciferrii (strain ATCC 14091 / BCRC 22168 / CBS 111 / JCM 3599 / NBRC 0793 / NRRL Y-1031 F-60-10) TaxID=1206466 RepID=K0KKK1_WICCF|nr:3-oxoacyl-[acyl-carrier-protein] reductase [Wickerhamomyces ciferrii]CCH45730.1 3-oxoacyl-[acyl-carrier-protein] reductase [Wickerhamomyces ciferrii]